MNKLIIHIIFSLFILSSCGTNKLAVEEQNKISQNDYPYISAFHQGLRLKTKGRTDEAIKKLEECLLIRQDDDAVYYALSKLELSKGNLDASAIYIVKAHELSPKNTWYIQELAYMYFEQENYPESVVNFEKLVEIEPRKVEWQYGYAEALVRTGDLDKAIEALNKTEDQVGLNPSLSVQKYNLYMDKKDPVKALEELDLAKEAYPKDAQVIATYVDHYFRTNEEQKAVSMLEELVVADPMNGRAHLALADIYLSQRKETEAYQQLNLAFKCSDVDIDTKMKILIKIHESSSKIDPVVYELVNELVLDHPEEAKAHSIRGDYLLRANKEEDALKSYKMALNYDETLFPIWNQVLIMEYQAKKYEELFDDSKECMLLYPSIAVVYLLNGVSANQLKKYNVAVDVLSVGVELVVNDNPVKAEFYGQLGDSYFGLKDYDLGKKKYQKAMSTDPQSALITNNFAYRLAKEKIDLELAKQLALKVTTMAPNQAQFIDTYGFTLLQNKEFNKAKAQFLKAYDLDQNDNLILEHLGDTELQLGSPALAKEWWKKALEIDKDNEQLKLKIANN